jgi:exodeoxyribonuclease III
MLDSFKADIICFQKTKLSREKLQLKMVNLQNYHAFYNFSESKITNGGVATFCKKTTATPLEACIGYYGNDYIDMDKEGRCLVTDHGDFLLFNVYFPTNGAKDRILFKVWFFYVIQELLEKASAQDKNVILAADLSFAHKIIDHYAPEGFLKHMGIKNFDEHRGRQWLTNFLDTGRFVDTFRFLYPEEKSYTYWKNQVLKDENCGIRLDYFIISKKFAQCSVENCKVMSVTGFGHAPVKLILGHTQSFIPDKPPIDSDAYLQDTKQSLHNYFPDVPASITIKTQKPQKNYCEKTEGTVLCIHNEPAVVREVKKPGKNNGRPFYCCKRPPGHFKDPFARCRYFKWADEEINQKCFHDKLTTIKRVKGDGKNRGKWYHCCKKITNDKCDYFKWADQLNQALEEPETSATYAQSGK